MSDLKAVIRACLWRAVNRTSDIISATLTGSFVESEGLEGVSDIDFVVLLDHLDRACFGRVIGTFEAELAPALAGMGWALRINPTLGPLKFNDERTAVLHLMLYSRERHVEHAIQSPFTVLDWQRSAEHRGASMAQVYPVFGLQPATFPEPGRIATTSATSSTDRSPTGNSSVTTTGTGGEARQADDRSRSRRIRLPHHAVPDAESRQAHLPGQRGIARRRARRAVSRCLPRGCRRGPGPLGDARIGQAIAILRRGAARPPGPHRPLHDRVRRAVSQGIRDRGGDTPGVPACADRGKRGRRRGGPVPRRSDPPIRGVGPMELEPLARAAQALAPNRLFVSPLLRCRQSLALVAGGLCAAEPIADPRLSEFDYGDLEGAPSQARGIHPELFEAWARGEDPSFPGGGESNAQVLGRAMSFAGQSWAAGDRSLTCTHNGVLRLLVSGVLGVPIAEAHRLRVPFLTPIRFVRTPRFGLFLDLDPEVERVPVPGLGQPRRGAVHTPGARRRARLGGGAVMQIVVPMAGAGKRLC
ncbi:MAG: histidine phosphatase family protein [Phycisphaerales bacterium]|nr:histidine phosphatase family protein [Phycisphaerales bacterium]